MPLKPGSSKETISTNIREFHGGKTYAHTAAKFGAKKANAQAIAVALSTARKRRRKYAEGGEVLPAPSPWDEEAVAEAFRPHDPNPFGKPTRPPFQIQGPFGMENVDPNDSPFRGFGRPEDKSYGAVHDLYSKAGEAVHRYAGPGFSQALNKVGSFGSMIAPGSGEQASMEDAVKTKEAIQEGKPGEAAVHGAGSVFNATLGSMPGAAIVTKLGMPLMAMAARRQGRAEPTIETPKEAIGYLRDNLQIDPKRDLGYSHHQDYVDLARYYQRESQQHGMTPKEIRWRDIYGEGSVLDNPQARTPEPVADHPPRRGDYLNREDWEAATASYRERAAPQGEPKPLTPYDEGLAMIREVAADPKAARAWEKFTNEVAERGYKPEDLPELKQVIGGPPEEFAARLYLMANTRPALVNEIFRSLEPSFGNQISEIMSRYHAARPGAEPARPSRPADMLIDEARGAREPEWQPSQADRDWLEEVVPRGQDPEPSARDIENWTRQQYEAMGIPNEYENFNQPRQPTQAEWNQFEIAATEHHNETLADIARRERHQNVNQNYDSPWSTPDTVGPAQPFQPERFPLHTRGRAISTVAEATTYLRDNLGLARMRNQSARDFIAEAQFLQRGSIQRGWTPQEVRDYAHGTIDRPPIRTPGGRELTEAEIDQTLGIVRAPAVNRTLRGRNRIETAPAEEVPPSPEEQKITDLQKKYMEQAFPGRSHAISREAIPSLEKVLPYYNGNLNEFLDHFFAGTFNRDQSGSGISRHYGGGITFRNENMVHPLTKVEIYDSAMTRSLFTGHDQNKASHDYLRLPDDMQASGFTKSILKNQFELYKKMNLHSVDTHANINIGGYAWAKYGWVPDATSWRYVGMRVREKVNEARAFKHLTPSEASWITNITNNPDPRAMWQIADIAALSPHKMDDGTPRKWECPVGWFRLEWKLQPKGYTLNG